MQTLGAAQGTARDLVFFGLLKSVPALEAFKFLFDFCVNLHFEFFVVTAPRGLHKRKFVLPHSESRQRVSLAEVAAVVALDAHLANRVKIGHVALRLFRDHGHRHLAQVRF